MTTSNRATVSSKIQSTETQDFDPRDLALRYYYAAIDRQLSDGSTLVNAHISPNFRTLKRPNSFAMTVALKMRVLLAQCSFAEIRKSETRWSMMFS